MKMSSNNESAKNDMEDASSERRAKSSPSLFSLFEKMFNIVKKYW
tara:strand:- start:263 stop:397 length:135 start_codon:yes stop_codon:yes gene_type:complete